MSNQEFHQKTKEVICRFKNGEELYHKSALFNMVVQMLVRGADIYETMEQLIYTTEDTQKAFEHHIMLDCPKMVVSMSSIAISEINREMEKDE